MVDVLVSRETNPEKVLPKSFHSNMKPTVSFPYMVPHNSSSATVIPSSDVNCAVTWQTEIGWMLGVDLGCKSDTDCDWLS